MLQFLLDEHISYVVADGLAARRPDISIVSVKTWRSGGLDSQADRLVLQAAAEDSLTLVTFDLRTIPSLVIEWGALELVHAGVVFVDERTIRPDDFGGLIRALAWLWDHEQAADWANRIHFLRVP